MDRGVIRASLVESAFYPVKVIAVAALPGNTHHIEAAGDIMTLEAGEQIVGGGLDDLALFGAGDCFQRIAEVAVLTVAHFHEHQGVPIQHNQINFAHLAGVVGFPEVQRFGLQIAPHFLFDFLPQLALILWRVVR